VQAESISVSHVCTADKDGVILTAVAVKIQLGAAAIPNGNSLSRASDRVLG
jgi:hypothetical protein